MPKCPREMTGFSIFRLFQPKKPTKMLKNNKIDGYIVAERPIKLVVNKSGLNQSIIKSFADNYMHTVSATENILARILPNPKII